MRSQGIALLFTAHMSCSSCNPNKDELMDLDSLFVEKSCGTIRRLIGNIRMLSKNKLIFPLLSSNLPLVVASSFSSFVFGFLSSCILSSFSIPRLYPQIPFSRLITPYTKLVRCHQRYQYQRKIQLSELSFANDLGFTTYGNHLALSEKGYVKRMKLDTFNLQNRGTIGKSVGKLRVNDTMSDFLACRAHDRRLYFSDKGTVYSAPAYKIPECSRAVAGTPLIQALFDGERITSIIPVSEFAEDRYLLMLTANGYIKKVSLMYFSSSRSSGIIALQLFPGYSFKWVRHCTNEDYVAMASQNGFVILSSCEII